MPCVARGDHDDTPLVSRWEDDLTAARAGGAVTRLSDVARLVPRQNPNERRGAVIPPGIGW